MSMNFRIYSSCISGILSRIFEYHFVLFSLTEQLTTVSYYVILINANSSFYAQATKSRWFQRIIIFGCLLMQSHQTGNILPIFCLFKKTAFQPSQINTTIISFIFGPQYCFFSPPFFVQGDVQLNQLISYLPLWIW